MTQFVAVQDHYPEDYRHCYGCGAHNMVGLQLKSGWVDGELVAHFTPGPQHIAVFGFVYGGLIASLIDCHAIGTAAAAAERKAGRDIGEAPAPRYVTAALRVDYLRPTPLGPELVLRAEQQDATAGKNVILVRLFAGDVETARGEAVAVMMPDSMNAKP